MESPVIKADILQMAQQLARKRLAKGAPLTEPQKVFTYQQILDGASVYPREVVKLTLIRNHIFFAEQIKRVTSHHPFRISVSKSRRDNT